MVVALGPGKFYGSSLPRPRIYTDVKFSDERVDPPVPVMDPLISWAEEAHWSMGGLSFTRHRLQGRIEGNVEKLRAEREKVYKKAQKEKKSGSPVTPPAPVAVKHRRRLLVDEPEDEEEKGPAVMEKRREIRKTARKLKDDFDRVADEKRASPSAGGKKRSRGSEEEGGGQDKIKGKSKGKKEIGKKNAEKAAKGTRTSPRLASFR